MRAYKIKVETELGILTTSEVKDHLKVDTTADDTLIGNLITAATQSAQEYTNRFFLTHTLVQYADKWSGVANLFKSPVQSVASIKYYDTDNVLQTLSSSVYLLDNVNMPSRIALAPDQEFPDIADRINAIEITYDVGVATASDVEDGIKEAVLLTIGHWYQNREAVVIGRISTEIPMSAKYLLDQYKIQVVR